MHPVEHIYYFSNAFTPSLFLPLSPLVFTWNFIHLTIAPGAGHSGFEDHFQSDQYHYVHHAKFECNYGSPMSGCIDQALGTFRETLGQSKVYIGEWSEKDDDNLPAIAAAAKKSDQTKIWSPSGYLGLPASWDHGVYTAYWVSLFPLTWAGATGTLGTHNAAYSTAAIVAYSPVAVALVLSHLSGDRMSWRWPFQKESVGGVFGLFLLLAWGACILPVYHATLWAAQLN